jgi:hypothetical protein
MRKRSVAKFSENLIKNKKILRLPILFISVKA